MHMARFPEKIDSKFRFVLLAARRAEQLIRGAQERMPRESPKFARHAMSEVQHEMVAWDYGEAPESSESAGAEGGNLQPGDDAFGRRSTVN
jgi:DNA-directed RNA polymerase omega subunit